MWPFHHLLFCSSHLVYQKPNSVLPQISLLWRLHRFHCPLSQVGTVSFLVLRGLKAMEALWLWGLALLAMGRSVYAVGEPPAVESPLMVNLTLIYSATDKGAVCLDGSLPAFHLHRGHGSGMNSWVVNLEGGGWCNSRRSCVYLKTSRHGSSNYMENMLPFTGMLSDKPEENPDFYNWNRVKIRYCDGASFSGEGYDEIGNLYFRGQRIWSSALEELMSKGLNQAEQVLLSGCSAGGLSTILRCDEFRKLFPSSTKVKCFADAGLFLNTIDIANVRAVRNFFDGVVSLQGVERNLPEYCTSQMDPKLCFFPQYLLDSIQTPLFLLNSAYDLWQIEESIAPQSADPGGQWMACKRSHANCSQAQLEVLQGFREEMVNAVARFTVWDKNGLFLNSCFAHCQSEHQNAWFAVDSPRLQGRAIAQAVGDWFFDHAAVKAIDCPYPCDGTCQHQN